MKTIRVLRNTGVHLPRFAEGQVVDVDDQTAELLCSLNLAELLKAIPGEPLKAIPENPTILAAESKLADIKSRWTEDVAPLSKSKRQVKTKPESEE